MCIHSSEHEWVYTAGGRALWNRFERSVSHPRIGISEQIEVPGCSADQNALSVPCLESAARKSSPRLPFVNTPGISMSRAFGGSGWSVPFLCSMRRTDRRTERTEGIWVTALWLSVDMVCVTICCGVPKVSSACLFYFRLGFGGISQKAIWRVGMLICPVNIFTS